MPPTGRQANQVPNVAKLLVATGNPGKLKEFAGMLAGVPFELVSLADAGIDDEVPETGSTFEENAALKATGYAAMSGMITLADDSGLEVEALGGDPGVRSARYAGEGASEAQRMALLLQNLENVPESERQARFRCVIALARPDQAAAFFYGECRGRITESPRGGHGFGYDPVFLLPEFGRTMAELDVEEKARVSHRGMAAQGAVKALRAMGLRSEGVRC
jgi:XTP/dITP diphosphohydrolase